MKALLILTEQFEGLAQIAVNRPSVLLALADKPILAHMIVHLLDYQIEDIAVVVPESEKAAVVGWLSSSLADYPVAVHGVSGAMSPLAALRELDSDALGDGDLLLLSNEAIVMHDDWVGLAQDGADAVVLGRSAVWLREGGTAVQKLIKSDGETLAECVVQSGLAVVEKRPFKRFAITTTDELLQTNQRLLGGGFSSPEALERSYTEEFGVIPPVFIHKDAEVYSAMIGPYVSIGAGVVVENVVLRDTIIDSGADVRELVLEKTIVGAGATLHGKPVTAIVADETNEQRD